MGQSGIASAAGSPATSDGTSVAPAMLIRTLPGHVTMWSAAMEQRYGFSSGEALGQAAHELLRTVFWKPQRDIEAVLMERQSWSGGLMHRRSDGKTVLTAHYWHLHQAVDCSEPLLSELHADVALADTHCADVLADLVGSIGHELSQPLTAMANYVIGASRALQPERTDNMKPNEALLAAIEQIDRIKEGMSLFRELSETLRCSTKQVRGAPNDRGMEAGDH
jgi:signal transduction histidine kinase